MRRVPSVGGAVDGHRAERRRSLLDAADRIIRTAGPEASMTAIAAAAGVTKPILYRHFGDKAGLYRALAERYVEPLKLAVRAAMSVHGPGAERLRATIDAYLAFIEREPEVYRFLVHRAPSEEPEARSLISDTIRQLGDEVSAAMQATRGRSGEAALTSAALGHGLVGMVHVAGDWWLEHPQLPRERLVDHLVAVLWEGLAGLQAGTSSPDAR
jgi:AcrR family transcriptional regulator